MAKDYEIFSDAKEGSSTSVKFIYETEKIGQYLLKTYTPLIK